jgi:NADP-dependent 3-hydroxy acid dehydrogenase YdfG
MELCDTTDDIRKVIKSTHNFPVKHHNEVYQAESEVIYHVSAAVPHKLTISKHSAILEEFIKLNEVPDDITTLVITYFPDKPERLIDITHDYYIAFTKTIFNLIKKLNTLLKTNTYKVLFLSNLDYEFSSIFNAIVKCWKSENSNYWLKSVAIDINQDTNLEQIINNELSSKATLSLQNSVEYHSNKRVRSELVELTEHNQKHYIKSGDVIFVTGGSRGIVPGMLFSLCSTIPNLTLIVTGRSPSNYKSNKINGTSDNTHEINSNLKKLSRISNLDYVVCDISNYDSFTQVLEATKKKYQKIDAFIHTAGLSIDQTVDKISYSEWRAVLDTKIVPLIALSKTLDINKLKIFIGFSSAAALFGNLKQAAYSAANSVLEKFTHNIKTCCPAKSLAFTAIEGGMVSDGLRAVMKTLDLTCISQKSIENCLVESMNHHNNGKTIEYIANDKMFVSQIDKESIERSIFDRFIGSYYEINHQSSSINVPIKLNTHDLARFNDHKFFGKKVVPASFILDKILNLCTTIYPNQQYIRIKEYHAAEMIVVSEKHNQTSHLMFSIRFNSEQTEIHLLEGKRLKATAIIDEQADLTPAHTHFVDEITADTSSAQVYGPDKIDLGSEYHIISKVNNLNPLAVSINTTIDDKCFSPYEAAMESITQGIALYSSHYHHYPCFPYKIKNLNIKLKHIACKFHVAIGVHNFPLQEPICSTTVQVSDESGNQLVSCETWNNVYNRFLDLEITDKEIYGKAKVNDLKLKSQISKAAGIDPCHYFEFHNIDIECNDVLKCAMALVLSKLGITNKLEFEFNTNIFSTTYLERHIKAAISGDSVYIFAISQPFDIVLPTKSSIDITSVIIDEKIPVIQGQKFTEQLITSCSELLRLHSDNLKELQSTQDGYRVIGNKSSHIVKTFGDLLFAYQDSYSFRKTG